MKNERATNAACLEKIKRRTADWTIGHSFYPRDDINQKGKESAGRKTQKAASHTDVLSPKWLFRDLYPVVVVVRDLLGLFLDRYQPRQTVAIRVPLRRVQDWGHVGYQASIRMTDGTGQCGDW